MKRRFWVALLTILVTLCVCAGFTACGSGSDSSNSNGDHNSDTETDVELVLEYRELRHGEVEVFSNTPKAKAEKLTIPASIDGNKVVAIAKNGFKGFTNIREIEFEDGSELETINDYAFSGCSLLENIELPDTVEKLGSYAFQKCSALEYAIVPLGVDEVGAYPFIGCNTTTLDVYCEAVSKPSGWDDHYASNRTTGSYTDFNYWFGAKSVEYSLKNYKAYIKINDTVAITHFNGKDYEVIVPDEINGRSVTEICKYAFSECTGIQSLTLPTELKTISNYAFSGCSLLESIELPDTVEKVGSYAFQKCSALEYAIVPLGVDEVGAYPFIGCNTTTLDVYCEAVSKPSGWDDHYASNRTTGSYTDFNYWFGAKSVEYSLKNYKAYIKINDTVAITHFNGKDYEVVVPDEINGRSVTEICKYAFSECLNMTSLTLPQNLTAIGAYAFNQCQSLTSLIVPAEVNSIGSYAFTKCTALESVYIPISVTAVGAYPFFGCSTSKLTIKCGANSKPSGWDDHYASNRTTGSYTDFTFKWGQSGI